MDRSIEFLKHPMRIFRSVMVLILLAPVSIFADSFNESSLHDELLSDNAGIENQALSRLEFLSPEQKRQLVPKLVQALQSHDAAAARAAAALAILGPAAEGALPELVDALHIDEEAVTANIAQAIVKVGPAAVKPLQAALSDPNFLMRRRAAEILGKLGGSAKGAAPDLVIELNDEHPEVGAAARSTLIHLGADAVPALSAALRKADDNVRQQLVAILGKCGTAATPVLISELKKDQSGYVRSQAATALGESPAVSDEIVHVLINALGDLDDGVRAAAADAIGQLGAKTKAALGPLVVCAHEDKEALVRHKAADAISAVGKADTHSLEGLTKAFGETDEGVRLEVVALFYPSDIPMADTVSFLTKAIHDPSPAVRLGVVEAAGAFTAPSTDGLPIFKAAMGDSEAQVRAAAILHLGQMRQAPDQAAAILMAALKDPNSELREKTIRALKALGPAGLPGLIQALQDPYSILGDEAAKAIVSIGVPALPLLEPMVGGPDAALSKKAAALIRRIHQKHASSSS